MSEIRRNQLTGELVLYSEIRAARPLHYESLREFIINPELCPFCPENEALAAPLIMKHGFVRIIENMYPAVEREDGVHEVLIDTPSHTKKTQELTTNELSEVLHAICERTKAISADKNIKCIQVFKNQGINAGASQTHSHWQIIGMTEYPLAKVFQEMNFKDAKGCPLCGNIPDELIIAKTKNFISFCPYASRFGYELTMAPKTHFPRLDAMSSQLLDEAAALLSDMLARMTKMLGDIDYNIIFNDSLFGTGCDSHFSIQLVPRLGRVAGFELATGCYINSVFPEKAAADYRAIDLSRQI